MIRRNGFTDETLEWRSWLRPLDLAEATPLQLEVLDESHPQSRTSPYYLTLAHQPLMLRHRSAAYNAIMYAPGGLPRAEREKAIAQFAIAVTERPDRLSAQDIAPLRAVGMSDEEIIDLLHAVAIFGWANRLMQNLGEPAEGSAA